MSGSQSPGAEPKASMFNGVVVRLSVFSAANGVPQGGILSPRLFKIYNDDLSVFLSNVNAGCTFGGISVNPFYYADDMAILNPSASGLQKLLNICASYIITYYVDIDLTRFNKI